MTIAVKEPLKMLVVIASYGVANDKYLARIVAEYRDMPYSTDIVVLSNIPKPVGDGVQVVVGLPSRDPWSLPFGHKQIFADRVNEYDLFLYSEDDVLITRNNIAAFLRVSAVLPEGEIAGFLRFEEASDGSVSYPDVHGGYHWDAQSVRCRGEYTLGFFTNEHAASYIVTRDHLRRMLRSGGFLVPPHRGRYDLLCTAATDPYAQCGMVKLVCVSHIEEFLIHHLPNKYAGRLGISSRDFDVQLRALLGIASERNPPRPLLEMNTRSKATHFCKSYYEPSRTDLINLVPASARTVLSIGCGWGATEKELAQRGKRVIALPLDSVISACASLRGVEVVEGDLVSALHELSGMKFDCILMSNILHVVEDPIELLQSLLPFTTHKTAVVASVPNLSRLAVRWKKLAGKETHDNLGDFGKSGVQLTSRSRVRRWLRRGGLRIERFVDAVPPRFQAVCRASGGLLTPLLSSDIVAVALPENLATQEYPASEVRGAGRTKSNRGLATPVHTA